MEMCRFNSEHDIRHHSQQYCGHISAACITLQKCTGRALSWSACRHHVGEVILTQVFNDMNIEASRSAEYTVFSRFKKNFDTVPHGSDETLSVFDENLLANDAETQSIITHWQENTVAVAEAVVHHQREDYKEFTELCLLYLDNGGNSRSFNFRLVPFIKLAGWPKFCMLSNGSFRESDQFAA